ncbi:MAG: helix-turn-helix domain-containing protein [Verrucomicrobiales bacterium]
MSHQFNPNDFFATLGRPYAGERIFDQISDTVYFIKDHLGRYVVVNQTLADRCDFLSKDELVGRTAEDVFPAPLGSDYTQQDLDVLRKGKSIRGQLELHLYPNGRQGWCLTWKEPIMSASGEIAGVSGISRDISSNSDVDKDLDAVSKTLTFIRENIDSPLRLTDLAENAGLSTYQLDQRIRSLFGVSAGQYVTRSRIQAACHLLERTQEPISQIALSCGYGDQSAFTRQFRLSVGITPKAYRKQKQ